MKNKLLFVLLALLLLSSCKQTPEYQRFSGSTQTSGFDTTIQLLAYAKDESEFNRYFDQLKQEFLHYNELFDKYNNYDGVNNLKTINDNAGKQPVEVDPHIIKMLLMAKEQYDENYQKFDPTIGALLEVWHDYREEGLILNNQDEFGEIPPLELLQEKKECSGWDLVEIDETKNTVFLTKACASLDLGGIAKGYATELVADSLKEKGLESFSISSGGNIKVMDKKPDGSPYNIGIGEPVLISLDTHVDVFKIDKEMSVVTSGDYQRYYYGPNMEVLHHLIDPQSMMPSHFYKSATIVTPDSGYADLYSTVLFLLDYETGNEWLKEHNENHPETPLEAFWIIDETSELWNHPDFIESKVNDKIYKVSMTQGLKPLSRLLNP